MDSYDDTDHRHLRPTAGCFVCLYVLVLHIVNTPDVDTETRGELVVTNRTGALDVLE